jgi:hypothetical protein
MPVVDDVGSSGSVPKPGRSNARAGSERFDLLPVHARIGDAGVQQDPLSHPRRTAVG